MYMAWLPIFKQFIRKGGGDVGGPKLQEMMDLVLDSQIQLQKMMELVIENQQRLQAMLGTIVDIELPQPQEVIKEEDRSRHFRVAKLFQQIRINKNEQTDKKQQVQALASQMQQKQFDTADINFIRYLLEQDVSIEFLHAFVTWVDEPIEKLKKLSITEKITQKGEG